MLNADDTTNPLAGEHQDTEAVLRDSKVPFTLLRNGWYTENYGRNLPAARTTGLLLASVGDARVASASRQDFAQAVGAVVTTGGRLGKTYELSGDVAWNYNDLAATFSKLLGRTVVYQSVTPEQHLAALKDAGVPEQMVGHGR
jgi:NAD(P)H dehydrogenase (quinone)